MLEAQQLAQQEQEKRQAFFIQRYDRLLVWALQLTNQHRPSAEDLVQDAFIQFVLGRTSIEEIENVDGYLRRMLRYMHIARKTRTDQKAVDTAISLSDFDSLDLGWSNIDPSRRMQAQQELWQICSYACSRKETSRAGAVLILRFFHNYYPAEIAQLLRASRHNVDQWQNLARRELKQFLNSERGNLRLLNARKQSLGTAPPIYSESIDNLRDIIFAARKGECTPPAELQAIYLEKSVEITTAHIAHLVSCRICLDATNQILGLPLLDERHQSESGRATPPTPPTASGGGTSDEPPSDVRKRLEKRLRDVAEHKPKQLRVAVNGVIVGATKVNSEDSEFDLHLDHDAPVDFIEVTSEQHIQLLFVIPPSPANPNGSIWGRLALRDGRELSVRVEPGQQRAIHVHYFQRPLPQDVALADLLAQRVPMLSLVRTNESTRNRKIVWYRPLLRLFSKQDSTRDADENLPASSQAPSALSSWIGLHRRRLAWLIVVLALAGVVALFILKKDHGQTLTAQQILDRAKIAESANDKATQSVTHQVVSLEEHGSGKVNRFQIDIWRNKKQFALRVFDRNHRLVGGVWQGADGKRYVLHHGGSLKQESDSTSLDELLQNLPELWRLEMSATEFSKLGVKEGQLVETPEGYTVTYELDRAVGSTRLVKAILGLRRTDLRATSQTLVIQNNNETIEYRFVEEFVEQLQGSEVEPSIFEIEDKPGKTSVTPKAPLEDRVAVPRVAPAVQPASAELEIDVAYLLAKAKADRAEQLNLTRTATGALLVEGVVESKQRKEEILTTLAPVVNNSAVTLNIVAVDELPVAQSNNGPLEVTVQQSHTTAETIAVDRELRVFLSSRNPELKNESLDEAVRVMSSRLVNRSYAIVFRAVELKNLYSRLEKVDPASVPVETRNKWLRLLHEHAAELEREAKTLRAEIQPILFANANLNKVSTDEQLATQVTKVHALALECNDLVRASFTISSQRSTEVKSLHFLQSLMTIELLSSRIRNAQ
jgi:RNA polymerase sigma factor (sigma-70 family)